jgi:hypothetical protein
MTTTEGTMTAAADLLDGWGIRVETGEPEFQTLLAVDASGQAPGLVETILLAHCHAVLRLEITPGLVGADRPAAAPAGRRSVALRKEGGVWTARSALAGAGGAAATHEDVRRGWDSGKPLHTLLCDVLRFQLPRLAERWGDWHHTLMQAWTAPDLRPPAVSVVDWTDPARQRQRALRFLGTTDEVLDCELCGRTHLRATVRLAVLDAAGNPDGAVHFGRDCAARALRWTVAQVDARLKEAGQLDAAVDRDWRQRVARVRDEARAALLGSRFGTTDTWELTRQTGRSSAFRFLQEVVEPAWKELEARHPQEMPPAPTAY